MTLNVLDMQNKLKVKSTVHPTNSVEYKQWCEEFRFGLAHDLTRVKQRQHSLNDDYDFTKLIPKTDKFGFLNALKSLKLVDLW